jgi:hypothetical protein
METTTNIVGKYEVILGSIRATFEAEINERMARLKGVELEGLSCQREIDSVVVSLRWNNTAKATSVTIEDFRGQKISQSLKSDMFTHMDLLNILRELYK